MLRTVKMDLFDAPRGSVLVHACNAMGVWGSGIAAEFRKRFPKGDALYRNYCLTNKPPDILGSTLMTNEENYLIANLITSSGYGRNVDKEDEILVHTALAISDLVECLSQYLDDGILVYSNKFNSGLFNVPWHKTEYILEKYVKRYGLDWTVCDL
jgi:ADP-ribose 1''-phosphate phosphatase